MKQFIVTVRLPPSRRTGNPRDKIAGRCPVSGLHCTDVTAPDHSVLIPARNQRQVRQIAANRGYLHITRVEEVKPDG